MRDALGCVIVVTLAALLIQPRPLRAAADARLVIDRAQTFLGGVTAVRHVKSLEFKEEANTTVRMLLPKYYQIELTDPPHLVSFDGVRLLNRQRAPDGSTRIQSPANTTDVTGRGLRRLTEYTVMFLIETTPSYPMKVTVLRDHACGNIEGACLEFRPEAGPSDYFVEMVFDSGDGRPLAMLIPYSDGTNSGVSVWHLSDYHAVAGLKFPGSWSVSRVWQSGRQDQVSSHGHYTDFTVNPRLTSKDFELRK